MARKDQIGLALMIDTGITDAQTIQLSSDASTFMSEMFRSNITERVILTGDSQSTYWNNKVVRRADWNLQTLGYEFFATGVSGQTFTNVNTNFSSAGKEASYYKASRNSNIYGIWAGTNDISVGTTLVDLQNNFIAFCTAVHALGANAKVVAFPTMARNFSSDGPKTLLIDLYNVWLEANWATYADAYTGFPPGENYFKPRADFASDALYIAHNQTLVSNTTYFIDGTHLTELVGYKEWGDVFSEAILTL